MHDKWRALALFDAIPRVKGPSRHRRHRPHKAHGDKAYDYPDIRAALCERRITPRIARRRVDSSARLGRYRWVVERTLAWLHAMKRLRVREERRADLHLAFFQLGCCVVLHRTLVRYL